MKFPEESDDRPDDEEQGLNEPAPETGFDGPPKGQLLTVPSGLVTLIATGELAWKPRPEICTLWLGK